MKARKEAGSFGPSRPPEPVAPMAGVGEEACGKEWGACPSQGEEEGKKHVCGVVMDHRTSDRPHTCGPCHEAVKMKRPQKKKEMKA